MSRPSTVKAALANGPSAGCRCCPSPRRSPGPRTFKAGQLTIRDVAGLYIYDNTLLSIKVTGAQVKAYLE